MLGQPQSHRRRPMVIATHALPSRQPQGPMSPMEVVIEELQADQGVPGGIAFGEGVRLTREGIEPIPQGAVEPFHMHGASWLHRNPQRGAHLHREEPPMLIAMLDRLHQRDRLWDDQRRTPPFARQHWLSIGSHQDAPIAVPAITEPVQLAPVSPLDGAAHRLLDQILAQRTARAGDHEATLSVLHQASPAFSFVGLLRCPLFFCTNDQNSSISTWFRCRSPASTCVRASAWAAARLSQVLIVSYLCPVISSAARKLPRRITTNKACATSAAGVFNPYMGVPCVSPK